MLPHIGSESTLFASRAHEIYPVNICTHRKSADALARGFDIKTVILGEPRKTLPVAS